jgi:hypothetical protein
MYLLVLVLDMYMHMRPCARKSRTLDLSRKNFGANVTQAANKLLQIFCVVSFLIVKASSNKVPQLRVVCLNVFDLLF